MASIGSNRKMASGLIALKQIVEGTSTYTGIEFFDSLVMNLAQVLDAQGVWVSEYLEDVEKLKSLSFWYDGKLQKEYEYFVENTPCQPVIKNKRLIHIPDNIIDLFPIDNDLKSFGAVSYLGFPLMNEEGEILGHLALLDNKPMDEIPEAFAIFKIFAARAEAEIRRLISEKKLIENEAKLKRLVNGIMDSMIEFDIDLRITQSNQSALRVLEVKNELLISRHLKEFLNPESLKKVIQGVAHLDPSQEYVNSTWLQGHLHFLSKTNKIFPAEATLSSYFANDKKFYALFFRNVGERIKAQEAFKMLHVEANMLKEKLYTHEFDDIVGNSVRILASLELVQQVAPTDSTVLISGETGTGKELFAKAIHNKSHRSNKPLVTLNCAALPAELVESELFGHIKGAFTGAMSSREGRFSLANKGTLFLDEIGELPLSLQAKLLRVLQEGEFEPIGSSKTEKVDVRVVTATNRDLQEEVKAGKFREDLFYRLNVFPIEIAPLRDRENDVVLLAEAFIGKYCTRLGLPVPELDASNKKILLSYEWPGNVRELQNLVERALIIRKDGNLDFEILITPSTNAFTNNSNYEEKILSEFQIREMEKKNIINALNRTNWKIYGKGGAAELLQIPGTTLSSRIGKYGIKSNLSRKLFIEKSEEIFQ